NTLQRSPSTMGLRINFVIDLTGWCCFTNNSVFIPKLILFPHYDEGHISSALIICKKLILYSSLFSERDSLELCNHCSRCGHCVRRMDRHCPWINNCVGEDNHWLFLQLCFYSQILNFFTLVLDFCQYYYFQPLTRVSGLFVFKHELAFLRISTCMGLLMFGAMSGLFYTQLMGILTDTTTIEKMCHCCDEISKPRKAWQQTFAEVFGTRWKILWFVPFRKRQPLRIPYHFTNNV
ncbi:palmitoyltransferase ZDHHC21 isoform X1, partial [Acipenser oxyrinchus oxyrinchus]